MTPPDWLPAYQNLAIACAVLLVICAMLALVLWSTKRHRDPHIRVKCEAGIEKLVPSLAGLSHGYVPASPSACWWTRRAATAWATTRSTSSSSRRRSCTRVKAQEWNQRPALHKLKDNFYYLWNKML